jgi:hypothetical protein
MCASASESIELCFASRRLIMKLQYLDATPMIQALRDDPGTFEMRHRCMVHRASQHWLIFDENGNARILSRCSCAELPISRQHSRELKSAMEIWQQTYWRPLMAREAAERRTAEINRQFAAHFRRSRLRRTADLCLALLRITAWQPNYRIDPSLPEDNELCPRPPAATGRAHESELLSA